MLSLPPSDHPAGNPQLELLPKLLNALFKWKWLIVATTFAVAIPVALVLYMRTPLYETKMKILIKSARSQAALNFSAASQSTFTPAVTPQIVNSEVQVLRSPDLLIPAIQQSGYPLLAPGQPDTPGNRERALQALRVRMNFSPAGDSNVIEVSVQDPEPREAARLLNTLATLYLKKRAALQAGGENMPEFFATQVKYHRENFDRARVVLESLQEKDNIVHISNELETNLARLMAMEGTLKDLQAEIESSSKEVVALEAQIKEQPESITKERRQVLNPEVTAMQQKLVDLERQRDELLQRYQPGSRLVKDKESEIATLRAAIATKERNVVGETLYATNSIRDLLRQQLLAKQVAVEAAGAKRVALIKEKKSYEDRLDVLKGRTFDLARVRGDYDLARETYFMYEKKAEEARISQAMDEENIVNAGIVQEASAPVIPLPRNLLTLGPIAAVAGAALGVALALVLEFFSLTIKDERDIEQFLQVPVLATVRHF
jgi:uncharacterized protein involved in exopolysaccharide biosynthesis